MELAWSESTESPLRPVLHKDTGEQEVRMRAWGRGARPLQGSMGCGEGCKTLVSRLSWKPSFRGNSLWDYRLFRNKPSFSIAIEYGFLFGFNLGDSTMYRIATKPHALRLLILWKQSELVADYLEPSTLLFPPFSSPIWPVFTWTCPTMTSDSTSPRPILSSTFLLVYGNILF